MVVKICPYCQLEVDEEALACSHCGRAIVNPNVVDQSSEDVGRSSIPGFPSRKRNQLALWSLIMGCVSFPFSVMYLALVIGAQTSGGGSDFQGALCFPFFMMGMAPVGFISVILGILGLVEIKKNGKGFGRGLAVAGILLGIPGSIALITFLYNLIK